MKVKVYYKKHTAKKLKTLGVYETKTIDELNKLIDDIVNLAVNDNDYYIEKEWRKEKWEDI